MGSYFDQIPDAIKHHIQEVTKTSGLLDSAESVDSAESLELISKAWLEKRDLFDRQIQLLHMHEVDALPPDTPKAAIMLTYSGSLVAVGVPEEGTRWAEYASIGLRQDVPAIAGTDRASLSDSMTRDRAISFSDGPIKKSSALLKIAVCGDEVSPAEQDHRIREATIFLTNGFVKINRTFISGEGPVPDQFTMKSMVAYLAAKNGMTQKGTKQLLEDYITLIETGVLLGERVPLGRLGRLRLKLRPPQKPRVGRNPATGEEMTIRAKPATYVPAFSPSGALKERASTVKVAD
jgi:nucleoid DNA-binding protein